MGSCGVRFSKEEMPQYTSHLDWHFRMKRREKDNAKRAQSRKWYFEKADWIVCDEIEDENADESIEEDEEEGWYLHNAMEHENVIYHPECFKDKNNVVDTSMDTTTDSGLDTSAVVTKEEPADTEEEEAKPSTEEMQQEDSTQETNDVKV